MLFWPIGMILVEDSKETKMELLSANSLPQPTLVIWYSRLSLKYVFILVSFVGKRNAEMQFHAIGERALENSEPIHLHLPDEHRQFTYSNPRKSH